MTTTAGTAWFPLVPRPRPPGLPLQTRITELTALAASLQQGTRQAQATRAAEILNKAALIVSDSGIPAVARDLCHLQRELLAQAAPLPAWAVRLALQPVLNIPRQLIRDGHGGDAYAMLEDLHQAAADRAAVVIDRAYIDFGTLAGTADGHKEARMLTWTALLADGTRALARAGRWKDAAGHAAAHRGIGARLLDGRQAAILALLANGQAGEAATMIEQSAVTEPWEHAIQAMLRVLCQHTAGQRPGTGTATMISAVHALTREQDPSTAVTRTRIALTALDLAGDSGAPQQRALRAELIVTGSADAYAARDLLANRQISKSLTSAQHSRLQAQVSAGGLGTRTIPGQHREQMISAIDRAGTALALSLKAKRRDWSG